MSVETPVLPIGDAFLSRHSTRNFSTQLWTEENQQKVASIVEQANRLPKLFGGQSEIILAPNGFGLINFIVHENGWLLAKQPKAENDENRLSSILTTGYLLEHCVIWMTQHSIATCWVAGTYLKGRSIEFAGGDCDVPAVVAFGGEDQDRWLDSVVKWFGSWRGKNEFHDKFYDLKLNKPITEETSGERDLLCKALAKIPCAMKPHSYRILFDEPQIHVFNTSTWEMSNFDMGIVLAHIQLYYQTIGKNVVFEKLETHPESPLGGNYLCTATLQ